MHHLLMFLVFLHYTESRIHMHIKCNQNVTLPCEAVNKGQSYRSVVWFRVQYPSSNNSKDKPERTGIIWKRKGNITSRNGSVVDLLKNESLFIQQATPLDAGTYECWLWANLGKTDQASYVNLTVSACIIPQTNLLMPTPSEPCAETLVEFRTDWVIMGFITLGLCKVALCVISVMMYRKLRRIRMKRIHSIS
ncbi:uncharacterized protein LOC114798720 isoform X2 [Denticeps clupeoides]|uniref:uncharacterized protein LOC114798720 isoform X2 n=1 Tax=Denticeps clupeoides TaxID=299321 RepID=UPI0010A56ED9|nr:uncharacterized protein LOC114798720 isoform X2 [Denticeps clupeoides]XP_028850479.1 uncharacterized protein LOC114798720 isoform X2 [Denticeps clupeoides]